MRERRQATSVNAKGQARTGNSFYFSSPKQKKFFWPWPSAGHRPANPIQGWHERPSSPLGWMMATGRIIDVSHVPIFVASGHLNFKSSPRWLALADWRIEMIFKLLSPASPIVFIPKINSIIRKSRESRGDRGFSASSFLLPTKNSFLTFRCVKPRVVSFGVEDFVILVCDGKKNDYYSRRGIWSNKQRVKEPRQGRALEVTLPCVSKRFFLFAARLLFLFEFFLFFRDASKSIVPREFKFVYEPTQWTLLGKLRYAKSGSKLRERRK